jgi:uncharacterized protein YkwD
VGFLVRLALDGLLSAASLFTLLAPAWALQNVPPPPKEFIQSARSLTEEVLRLVNEERATRDQAPLRRAVELDEAALYRARDMAVRDYFAHITPEGVTPGEHIMAAGYRPLMCGENIASGYPTPREVVQAWMASPSHRANILERRFRDIGLAFCEAPGTDSGVLWVQEFAEPQPQRLSRAQQPRSGRRSRRSTSGSRPVGSAADARTGHDAEERRQGSGSGSLPSSALAPR